MEDCLCSFLDQDLHIQYEVIIVDNASNDGSLEMVRKRFPFVQIIENDQNVGFARANNQAIVKAKGEYILLLNPDTLITDGTIFKRWTYFMDQHQDTGASGCTLVFPDGSHQVGDAGFKPGLITTLNFVFFLSRVFPYHCKGLFISPTHILKEREVDWVCGADFLVRRSILPTTGLLDETVFMYAEDVEWGCRIRSFGYKIYYLPKLEIIHFQGASSTNVNNGEGLSFLWLTNLHRLFKVYNRNQPVAIYELLLSMGFLLRGILYCMIYLGTGIRRRNFRKKSHRMFLYSVFCVKKIFDR